MQRTRRHVLVLSGALLSAGCLQTDPSPSEGGTPEPTDESTQSGSGEPPTDEPTQSDPEEPLTETEDCQSGITLSMEPYDPVSDLPVSLDDRERSIVTTAVSEGSADYTTHGSEPLRSDVIVRHDGAFYWTAFTLRTESVPAYTMDLYWEDGQAAPDDAMVVAFDDLPDSDQTVLEAAALSPEEDGEGDGLPQRTLSIQAYPAPYPEDGRNSRLVGGRTWVRWRDRTIRVDVAGASESTTERRTYHYTLELIAEGEAPFRQFVAARYVVDLDDLPASQRSIVAAAAEGRYEECTPASEALAALQDTLSNAEELPHPRDDSWYVAIDGERYRLRRMDWVH